MTDISRRRFLAASGTLAGAGLASLLPPSLHAAMARPMPSGGLDAIEHVIVLTQENRSFDHYFGTLRGVRGFGDPDPLPLRSGGDVFRQPRAGGDPVTPFSLRKQAEYEKRKPEEIQYLGDLDHSWSGSGKAWAQGFNDGWIAAKTPATMTYYDRQDIPLQYELADAFTICDAYHCSVFGSTNPNRNYLMSGTTGYEPGTSNRAVTNAAYSYDHAGYDWTSYPERLEAGGVSWQIYQEWDNFTDNATEYFVPFKRIGKKILAAVSQPFRTTEEFYYALLDAKPSKQEQLLAEFAAGRASLTDAERSLFDRGAARGRPQTLLSRVRADIDAGTLPAVSWLVPPAVDSEHPGASTPVGSANLIYDLLDIIASNPDVWSKTALFINFDENDGYFDHVPPPTPPRPASGNGDDYYNGQPIGLGPRVPMTVVSPWTVGGFVSSEVFDHTSVIRFLERWTGVQEPNISPWRRAVCGDLTSAFDFDNAGTPPALVEPGPVPKPFKRWRPTSPEPQPMAEQEPGTRPARPVPYAPAASATGAAEGLRVTLRNGGTRSAHFTVYDLRTPGALPIQLDVLGEESVVVPVASGYRVVVQGPAGFWAEFTG